MFEGVVRESWKSKVAFIKLFETLYERSSIDVNTYENIHRSKMETPIHNGSKISLDFIEREETNYGLRRYSVK